MTLLAQNKAVVCEEHEETKRSVSFTFRVPSVIRLLQTVRLRKRPVVQFTRLNVYARDEFQCQYCFDRFHPERLTLDHVLPESRGGRRVFENIVTACVPCNRRKDDRTPEEAGMPLKYKPRRPLVLAPMMKITVGWTTPDAWRTYLFMHARA
jgi:5-methylcytosine-specific restriction endonuclease McrA